MLPWIKGLLYTIQCEDKVHFRASTQIPLFSTNFAVSKVKPLSNFDALKTEEKFYFKEAVVALDPSLMLFEHALLCIN